MLLDITLSGFASQYGIVLLFVVIPVAYFVVQKYQKGLNQYPGPFLASITNNWRAVDIWKRNTHFTFRELHQKYGDIVRVAPNVLSFGHPSAISDIYGLNKGFTKVARSRCGLTCDADLFQSGYYDVFATLNKGTSVYNL